MSILQLDPPIPLDTPNGAGMAHLVLDPGIEHDLQWVVFIDASGACWTYRNRDVRLRPNITMNRHNVQADCSAPPAGGTVSKAPNANMRT